jgi:hypothetical protein
MAAQGIEVEHYAYDKSSRKKADVFVSGCRHGMFLVFIYLPLL